MNWPLFFTGSGHVRGGCVATVGPKNGFLNLFFFLLAVLQIFSLALKTINRGLCHIDRRVLLQRLVVEGVSMLCSITRW